LGVCFVWNLNFEIFNLKSLCLIRFIIAPDAAKTFSMPRPAFLPLILIAVTTLSASNIARASENRSAITPEQLVQRTQELYDAVSSGNQAPWKKYFADDCLFFDEKGHNMNKVALLTDLQPLPTGYSGTIKVVKPQSLILGDTAILSYDCDETETIFGQNLTARYHATDTWLRRDGKWQIIASQTLRYYEDPAVGQADPKKFAGYSGTYELAPGQTRTVSVENGSLFIERKGKKEQLFPETAEIFFRKGVEGRILFHLDEQGKVETLIDRRNNEDVVWRKTKD
jgi:hypothetical protein